LSDFLHLYFKTQSNIFPREESSIKTTLISLHCSGLQAALRFTKYKFLYLLFPLFG